MIDSHEGAGGVLHRAGRLHSRLVLHGEVAGAAWKAAAALMAVGATDAFCRWPAWVRGIALAVTLGLTVRHLARARRRAEGDAGPQESTARTLELCLPDLDNALIHAVQFSGILERTPEIAGADRMRLEAARADQAAARIAVERVFEPPVFTRNRRASALVAGLVLLTLLVFPRVYRFETPRVFLFWLDRPPFTMTDFDVAPQEAHVAPGAGLTVTVRVGGRMPHRMDLETGTAGDPSQTAPMGEAEDGVYTADLTNLTRDTWFRASADTGESIRYWARVDSPRMPRPSPNAAPPKAGQKSDAGKTDRPSAGGKAELQRLRRKKARVERALRTNAAARKRAGQRNTTARNKLEKAAQALKAQAAEVERRIVVARSESGTGGTTSTAKPPTGGTTAKPGNGGAQGNSPGVSGDPAGGRSVAGGGKNKPTGKGRTAPGPKTHDDALERRSPETDRPLSRATDSAVSRAPAQYRDLVRDYFKAVAGGK